MEMKVGYDMIGSFKAEKMDDGMREEEKSSLRALFCTARIAQSESSNRQRIGKLFGSADSLASGMPISEADEHYVWQKMGRDVGQFYGAKKKEERGCQRSMESGQHNQVTTRARPKKVAAYLQGSASQSWNNGSELRTRFLVQSMPLDRSMDYCVRHGRLKADWCVLL